MTPAQLGLKLSPRRHALHRLLDPRLGGVAVALGPEGFAGEVSPTILRGECATPCCRQADRSYHS